MNGLVTQASRRPRTPWRVAVGSGLAMAVSAGPMVISTLSLFVTPLTEETGGAAPR